ncbi:unnamed protein product [Camellia sinensis]
MSEPNSNGSSEAEEGGQRRLRRRQRLQLDWIKREYLKWPQRMGIVVGIARGIQFLHSGITLGMYGNDLKIENILLDKTLTAKISSYNISLPSKVGSESPLNGQDNPNKLSSTESAEKNDIYQLGVILLEVISGKPITSETQLAELKLQRFSRVTIEIVRNNRYFHSWHICTRIIKKCCRNHHEMPQQRFNLTSHH